MSSGQEIAAFELTQTEMSSYGFVPFQHFKDRRRTHKVSYQSHMQNQHAVGTS